MHAYGPVEFFNGTRKMSQNCNTADRAGVIEGLSETATVTKSVVRLTSFRKDDEPERLIVNEPSATWILSTSSTALRLHNDVLAPVGFCSRQVPYPARKSA